jgi:hypothetical protein
MFPKIAFCKSTGIMSVLFGLPFPEEAAILLLVYASKASRTKEIILPCCGKNRSENSENKSYIRYCCDCISTLSRNDRERLCAVHC